MNSTLKLVIAILSVAVGSLWLNMACAANNDGAKPLRADHLSSQSVFGRYVASSVIFGTGTKVPIGSVCRALVANFNQFRDVPFDSSHPRLSPKYPQFRRLDWKPMAWNPTLAEMVYSSCPNEACLREWMPTWHYWEEKTAPLRKAGKNLLWRARVDLMGDGRHETLLLLTHYFRPPVIGGRMLPVDPPKPYSRYIDSKIYMLPSPDPQMARRFNNGPGLGLGFFVTDIMQNVGRTGFPYLALAWTRDPAGMGVSAFQPVVGQPNQYLFDPLCNIRWIPRKE